MSLDWNTRAAISSCCASELGGQALVPHHPPQGHRAGRLTRRLSAMGQNVFPRTLNTGLPCPQTDAQVFGYTRARGA